MLPCLRCFWTIAKHDNCKYQHVDFKKNKKAYFLET
uniref:Uncharacterized protein n=1 Tax=Arundo donax TaxID=35708 RepID=A0A0A9BU07_ARUDO